ncbi:NAD(P)-binding protein [Massarina eburnea CBS 473.64]|uniref:NAD(P)-binding protein n=1 Tax=Massarina eburnea CBS 473.64 TaxID=1395130 RepID=A0A6A6S382_9PLEO|nr:NAD(P)-binding protein [Massarina eburnea CBS 473.64]
MAPPIRVALIGLSSHALVTWAADAHLPYLLSAIGRSHYQLVALLNSSVEAAEAAKKHFNLPSSTKAYGDPSALAADPNIDLVVCSTRVDIHFKTTEPSLRAGKPVFVEWPLAASLAQGIELTGGQTFPDSILGLQGRVSPITLRLKEILAAGTIGTVLSSEVHSFGSLLPRDGLPEAISFFADLKFGGNAINIENGHTIDYIHEVLGEFKTFDSKMQIQRPTLKVLGVDWTQTSGDVKQIGTIESTTPDLLSIHGPLEGSALVVDGALLTFTFRVGPPFKGQPALTWTINGTKGELMITIEGQYLHSHTIDGILIKYHDHVTDEVKELEWDWAEWQKELPVRSRIVSELYERYAEWVEGGKGEVKEGRGWPRLEDGVNRLKMFEVIYKQYDPNW